MVSKHKFVQAITQYVTRLKNNRGFEPLEGYQTPDGTTVNMRVNHKGVLIITKAETFENEVSILEGKLKDATNELKQTKKTVSTQEKEIEDLTAKLKEAETVPEETDEADLTPPTVSTTKKRGRKKKVESDI